MKLFSRSMLFVISTSLLFACSDGGESGGSAEPSRVQAFMADPAAVERGEALFIGTCAGYCHTLTRTDTDALFLFDCQWKHGGKDEEIFNTVTVGIPNTRMVGFGANFPEGEDDLWKIIAYLKTNQEPCA
ncbi:MAG: c-type cytochrome [Gammaproteobacteria bacterium]|nr:c-type cytochrome [Gammaproteobacteria bacterium]